MASGGDIRLSTDEPAAFERISSARNSYSDGFAEILRDTCPELVSGKAEF